MKRYLLGCGLAALMIVLQSSTVLAQFSLQLGGGVALPLRGVGFDGAEAVGSPPALITGSILGYDFSENVSLVVLASIIPSGNWETTLYGTRFDGTYSINYATLQLVYRFLGNGWTPYITAGVGYMQHRITHRSTTSDYGGVAAQAGIGYQFGLSSNWKLFTETQFAIGIQGLDVVQLVPLRAGIRYLF